jgi:hypothetical protein
MKKDQVDLFEKINGQMEALYDEIGALSKKSPNDAANKFKLNFVNKVLDEANSLLGPRYKPFPDFDSFNEDELPTNSDVTMILAQYLNCLEKLRSDNIKQTGFNSWSWILEDPREKIETASPKKLRVK